MYYKLPNLIMGFHGCDASTYENVFHKHNNLFPSKNPWDWLGHGVYFWENNYHRALEWAEEKVKRGEYTTPKVIGAIIDLGHCLNLTDSAYVPTLKTGYEMLLLRCESMGNTIPKNRGGKDLLLRDLDCAVIEQIHDYNSNIRHLLESEFDETFDDVFSGEFDSVRGVFIEGGAVYDGSGFMEKTHIQICIRNPNCIKGYFNPLEEDSNYPMP